MLYLFLFVIFGITSAGWKQDFEDAADKILVNTYFIFSNYLFFYFYYLDIY